MNKIFLLISVLAFVACSKNEEPEKLTRDNLFQIAVSAKWKVVLFANGDNILTNEFANYKFDFFTSNIAKATDGTNNYSGSWFADNTDNTTSTLGLVLNIQFAAPETFAGLSKDWDVISADQGTIRLRYINGESIDFLTLVSTAK